MSSLNQGHECYDWYHYLWHLIAIGAVQAQPADAEGAKYEITPDAWALLDLADDELPGAGETIALIDIGVNDEHPNLTPRILETVDFAAHPYGAHYEAREDPPDMGDGVQPWAPMKRGLEIALDSSLVGPGAWAMLEALPLPPAQAALVQRLKEGRGVRHKVPHTSRQRYPGHGTACAGLLVGAPASGEFDPSTICEGIESLDEGPIPYWGVAPGAQLLPIIVSGQPTAEQLIFAFLYAWDNEVSVIHFPREASDPWRAYKHQPGYGDTRYVSDDHARDAWDLFETVLQKVSDDIPVVCATGNDGYAHLIYPASKSNASNGLIAAGAVTYNARRASYSNYARQVDGGEEAGSGEEAEDAGEGSAVTLVAPSDDEEVYTRHQLRFDREAPAWRDHNFTVHSAHDSSLEIPYSPQALFTTDVPGPRGYADGFLQGTESEERLNEDRAALYTLFGGSSGASALVAGSVALLQAKNRAEFGTPLNGSGVKSRLLSSGVSQVAWPWLEVQPFPVQPDMPNGEATITFAEQFGAGVLDLHLLLQ